MADRDAYIDVLFRNELKEFEALPPVDVWENIRPIVRKKQKFTYLTGTAAVAAILFSLGFFSYWLTNEVSDSFTGPAISLNQEIMPEGVYVAKTEPFTIINNSTQNTPAESREPVIRNSFNPFIIDYQAKPVIDLDNVQTPENTFPGNRENNPFRENDYANSIPYTGKEIEISPEVLIAENNYNVSSRWSIGAMATPSYFSSFSSGREDVAKNLINSEKPAFSYSGGVSFSYKVNKRISIQTGIFYSSIGQNVTGINSYAGFDKYAESKSGSDFGVQTSSGLIISSNSDIFLQDISGARVYTRYTVDVFDPYKADLQYLDNSILQSFNYLEVPFMVRYKLIDRKLDFNLVGGLSYNLLVNNSASSIVSGVKYPVGKTDGLSPITFSSSFGMGMEYTLSERISFNLEPTFRYYLTPLGGIVGSAIHPYSFGVFSGLSYRF